ncbi:HAD family hydrolase [Tamilnaduibacter salinus]|uniref:3-deoxy-D-manno-octulosonate 8-phosphate phosphatase KdsC n=1 Tax=Tamilnaduibacter salinus TaxID=1484056 RepID=A0A2A2I106_9GAMM|nr:HAD hydrolase family protein [Tamilnaduibacter salinus]PAV25337.1 HAD family hydrolase [Tamilnaduibacter salinus]
MERPLPEDLITKAADIRLLALDVDGVMTDGKLYFSASGDEIKAFHSLDGQGIKQLQSAGITVAVITGRQSPLTERRMQDLGITHLRQGRSDKAAALRELLDELSLSPDAVAYMGDDLPDLGAIRLAGLGASVPNGHWYVRAQADFCTETAGGDGAVRELCDLILQAHEALADIHQTYETMV